MRIAISNTTRNWWGVQQVTDALARGFKARGHEVLVLCRPGSMMADRMRGVVQTAPVLGGMDLNPLSLWRIRRALRGFGADVVITTMKKDVRLAAPVGWALGIPVVVRHANDQPIRGGAYGRFLYGVLPSHHVTNARATRDTILASAPWLAAERVSVIHNGVDAPRFQAAARADLGLPEGDLAVGFVGSFAPRKGLLDLAAAWARIAAEAPRAHLVLVGKGPQEAELRERLAPSLRVHFAGYRGDVPEVMRALDVLVLPSYVEGAPNVVLEAMAAGTPVVATAVSGTPELMLDGETGRLVPPGDPAALADALLALIRDPGLRRRMGDAAAERARSEFSMSRMLDAYEELLARVARAAG